MTASLASHYWNWLTTGTRRELELQILNTLFKNAMNSQTEMDKAFECKDCMDQIKNFNGAKEIKFTNDDMGYLKVGFSKSADRRPDIWMEECYDLFKQIKDPIEEKLNKEE